jgi:hypothetical protein
MNIETDKIYNELTLSEARDKGFLYSISAMFEKSPKLYANVKPTGTFVLKGRFDFYEGSHFLVHNGIQFIINDPFYHVIDPIHRAAEWGSERFKFNEKYRSCGNIIDLEDNEFCLINSIWSGGNFAHLIGESLSKIALLTRTHDINSLVFLIPNWVKLYIDIFTDLGLRYYEISRDTVYRGNFLIPSLINHNTTTSLESHLFLVDLFNRIHDNSELMIKNLFISRRKAGKRDILNEDEVVKLIRDYVDIEIVFLEDLSFADQVRIVRNANLIIAPHGAGLQLSTLQKSGICLEIHSPYYINWSFADTYRANSVKSFNLFCKDEQQDESLINKIGHSDRNFHVDLTELRLILEQIFAQK